MARTTISPQNIPGGTTSQIAFTEFTWTSGDVTNGNQFASTGKEELLIRNTAVTSPGVSRKFQIVHPRGGKIEYTLPFGASMSLGIVPTAWKQTADSMVYISFPDTYATGDPGLQFAVLVHP